MIRIIAPTGRVYDYTGDPKAVEHDRAGVQIIGADRKVIAIHPYTSIEIIQFT